MYNEFKRTKGKDYLLSKNKETGEYLIRDTTDTPFLYHVALIKELKSGGHRSTLHLSLQYFAERS